MRDVYLFLPELSLQCGGDVGQTDPVSVDLLPEQPCMSACTLHRRLDSTATTLCGRNQTTSGHDTGKPPAVGDEGIQFRGHCRYHRIPQDSGYLFDDVIGR